MDSELNPFQSPSAFATDDPTVRDPTVRDPTVRDPTVRDPTVRDPTGLKWLIGGFVAFVVCVLFLLIKFPEVCAYIGERSAVFPSRLRTVLNVVGFIFDHNAVLFLPTAFVVGINELFARGRRKHKVRRVIGIGVCAILFLFALWVAWAIVSTMP